MDTGNLSVFKYDGWLGKGKEAVQESVDIPATERGKKVIDSKSINYHTHLVWQESHRQ
jgi:hypothetical protein